MDKYEALIRFGITNLLVVVLCSASGVVYGTVTCGFILLIGVIEQITLKSWKCVWSEEGE